MRKAKLLQLEHVDSRTVYVEEFPTNIDHEWLKTIFTTCGTVNYVSLPKYKHNSQVKGFAFIEFSTSEEAHKACQVLNTIEKKESEDGEKEPKRRRKRRSNSESSSTTNALPGGGLQRQNSNKRRRSVSESSEGGSPAKSTSRKRRTSFCSIEENEAERSSSDRDLIPTDKRVTPLPTTPTSKRKKSRSRSRSISVSSDISVASSTDLIAAKGKNATSKCLALDTTNNSLNALNVEEKSDEPEKGAAATLDSSLTTKASRKRKASKTSDKADADNRAEKVGKSTVSVRDDSETKSTLIEPGIQCTNDNSSDTLHAKATDKDTQAVETNARKRKSSVSDESTTKKGKLDESESAVKEEEAEGNDALEGGCNAADELLNDEDEGKKKKKKKNRQHKKKEETNSNDHPKVPPLHVIPKSEWLMLKKEYKRLQFTKMSELKKKLKVLKYEEVRRDELKERIFTSIAAKNENTKTEQIEQDAEPEDVKCEGEKENCEVKVVESELQALQTDKKPRTGLELNTGTVAALKTSCENLTRSTIKDTLSSVANVAYVDYVDGVYQGHVRFVSAGDLDKICALNEADKQNWMFQLRKLEKEEEEEYFVRAEEKRMQKYEKGQRKKIKKVRGVEKITRQIENAVNHIHFT